MNIALTFKNFEPSDHLRRYASRRFEKLGRFVPKADNVTMTVVLTVDKFRHKADVQFSGDNIAISAVEQSSDMYATVDMVLDKVEVQLKKHAERIKEKRRNKSSSAASTGGFPEAQSADTSGLFIEEETVEPKPMFPDEAALQLEQRRDDPVLIFINADTDRINVMYRRKEGGLALIDPVM